MPPLIRISSAHLDTNDQPSTAIAAYVEATRAQSIAPLATMTLR